MQVDIGNNTVRQNFSSIVLSEEIRQLNDRLQQEYAGAAFAATTVASHQERGGVGSVLSPRREHLCAVGGAAGVPSQHDSFSRSRRHPSLNLSRSSAGSRHSHHQRETRQHGSISHSHSEQSHSPEKFALRAGQAIVGVSHIGPVPWIATPANSTATIHRATSPSRANISVETPGRSNTIAQPHPTQQLPLPPPPQAAAAGFGGAGPSVVPMAAVTSTQHRQQGWSDVLPHNGGAASAAATVDDAPVHARDNANNGLIAREGDANHRADEGSGKCNDKPAPAGSPKLAQTKIKIGMRLRRWIIINRIGAGSFGETFTAMEVNGPAEEEEDSLTVSSENLKLLEHLPPPEERKEVCIKVEQENKNVLRLEALALKKVQPCSQVVRYLGSGCTNGMNYVVMQKLGSNLAELRRRSQHGTFNIYTTLKAGISCLTAIRGVHDLGLVHRDIKPSNFVTGLPGTPEHTTCYLIDFGLARRFRRSNGEIRPPRDNAGFRGTSRYASVASHHHQELGRVDDLWSLLFMLVEFATGTLPWRKYKEKDDIGRCKEESISPHLVRNLPREFQPFLAHLQTLRYEDEPDYDLLLTLMYRALDRRGYPANKPVEWEIDSSMADSGMDAEGVAVGNAGAGTARDSVAQPQDVGPAPGAVINGHTSAITASSRPLQPAPRRAAPQPGSVKIGPREPQLTPLPSGAAHPVTVAARSGSGNRSAGNGVAVYGYSPNTLPPYTSGALRVSEVDVGGFGAGQDSVRGNTPHGADALMHHQAPCLQCDSADVPGGTVDLALEGVETHRASTSSDECGIHDYSPREIDDGRSRVSTPVYNFNIAGPPDANSRGLFAPGGPLGSSLREPSNGSRLREAASNLNGVLRRMNQPQSGKKLDEPKCGKKGAWQPPQRMGGPTAELDTTVAGSVERQFRHCKTTGKKKTSCECTLM
ncbi:hypothetical protein LSCM4_01029 [Leishmania orientalis]|uniref:non-specific serine/threonine protein kinase n=1 Tax=Leishmania orientalis TaxID=2249476 RepID=A0A836GQ68_9TRYP|nr:hypothetical protein LSCM4_01029 [Leishmania orientalis]